MVRPLFDRKSLVILGLNSGTSADGLDMAAVRVTRRTGGLGIQFLAGKTIRYPAEVRRAILDAADSPKTPVTDLVYLDSMLGQWYGNAAKRYLNTLRQQSIQVDAIASHGQTVRHLPKQARLAGYRVHGTMQIGSPARIATQTGCVTVADFRQADVALDGEGAPITVAAMHEMFTSKRRARVIVNVGGMSNYFYFPAGNKLARVRAADCGPGNVLSDLLCKRLYQLPFDRNGARASHGQPSHRLLSALLASPYFSGSSRSTGREEFGEEMAGRMIALGKGMKLSGNDLLATAVELTAHAIASAVTPYLAKNSPSYPQHTTVDALYLTGGGAHNKFLRDRLSSRLGGLPVTSVRDLGFDPDLVEATAFAVMGASALWSWPLETRFGGATRKVRPILGMICQPPVQLKSQG